MLATFAVRTVALLRLGLTLGLLLQLPSGAAAQTATAELAGSRAVGTHFAVQLDWEAPELAEQALEAVEALWPAAEELYSLKTWEREDPLEVHLYGTDAGYSAADVELTGGNFDQNGAFAHFDSRTAHVRLAPQVHPKVLERFGLSNMTRRLLAHEAAHLIRFELYPNHRSHPAWFIHGTASLLDQAALVALGRSNPDAPWEQARYAKLQDLLRNNKLPDFKTALLPAGISQLEFYDKYNVSESLFMHLAAHKRAPKLWMELRRLGGSQDFAERTLEVIADVLGKSTLKRADKQWRKDIADHELVWEEVLRHLSPLPADFGEDAWLQLAFPTSNALAFRSAPQAKLPYLLRGTLEVLPGAVQQANLLLGEDSDGFTSLAWNPGVGLTLFRYSRPNNQWRNLGFIKARELPAEHAVEFEVRVDKSGVEVTWGTPGGAAEEASGNGRFDFEQAEWKLGRWGLGAQAGSAILWRGVQAARR